MTGVDAYLDYEKARLERIVDHLTEEIDSRPRGSIVMKTKSGHRYAYVVYRDKGKVLTDYVGKPMDRSVTRLAAKILERRKYRRELQKIRMELERIDRMIKAGKGGSGANPP
jgi:hypothetical protein